MTTNGPVEDWIFSIAAVMKYKIKKGCEVEVWNKRDVPSGSWCRAQILSGNGHTYSVKYFPYTSNDQAVERVSRKAIRPLPPVNGLSNWLPGDTVEVFDKYSWKAAEVVRAVGKGYYLVRLLGSSMAFRAHISTLRFQLSWQYDRWVLMRKNPVGDMDIRRPKEGNSNRQMLQQFIEAKKHSADDHFAFETDNGSKGYYQSFSNDKKKRPYIESCPEVERKMRAVGEERRHQRLVAGRIPKLPEKVDAVASRRAILGGKYMHASLKKRTQIIEEALPVLESSDTESISSSVGSCSPHYSPYRFINPIGLTEELGSDSSPEYTETFPMLGSVSPSPIKEAVAAEIHRLECHAYRTTLAALHACGPISWEQEALISDLRLKLNISTDEHLLEIRRLIAPVSVGPLT